MEINKLLAGLANLYDGVAGVGDEMMRGAPVLDAIRRRAEEAREAPPSAVKSAEMVIESKIKSERMSKALDDIVNAVELIKEVINHG